MHIVRPFDLIIGGILFRRHLFICIFELDFNFDSCIGIGIRGGKRENILVLLPGLAHLFAHCNELLDRINRLLEEAHSSCGPALDCIIRVFVLVFLSFFVRKLANDTLFYLHQRRCVQ